MLGILGAWTDGPGRCGLACSCSLACLRSVCLRQVNIRDSAGGLRWCSVWYLGAPKGVLVQRDGSGAFPTRLEMPPPGGSSLLAFHVAPILEVPKRLCHDLPLQDSSPEGCPPNGVTSPQRPARALDRLLRPVSPSALSKRAWPPLSRPFRGVDVAPSPLSFSLHKLPGRISVQLWEPHPAGS